MKKVYFNTLAILTIVLLIVGNFIFISNKKSNANTITIDVSKTTDMTYDNYDGWNLGGCASTGRNLFNGGSCPKWGDIDCDGEITEKDLLYLRDALESQNYLTCIAYDLADVAAPYGRIDYNDFAEISRVVYGESERGYLPIYKQIYKEGRRDLYWIDLFFLLDLESGFSTNDIGVATAIVTGGIKCIGAPRVITMGYSQTGYDVLEVISRLQSADSIDCISVVFSNNRVESRTFSPREPVNKWFEYKTTTSFSNVQYKLCY